MEPIDFSNRGHDWPVRGKTVIADSAAGRICGLDVASTGHGGVTQGGHTAARKKFVYISRRGTEGTESQLKLFNGGEFAVFGPGDILPEQSEYIHGQGGAKHSVCLGPANSYLALQVRSVYAQE